MANNPIPRRGFLLGSAAVAAAAQSAAPVSPDPHRRVHSLNRNWLYGGKTCAGVLDAAFDDSKWQRVALPHTNAPLPWHAFDEAAFQFVSA